MPSEHSNPPNRIAVPLAQRMPLLGWVVLATLYASAFLFNSWDYYEALLLVLAIPAAVLAGVNIRAAVILVAGTPALDSYAIISTEPQVVTVFQVVLVASLIGVAVGLVRSREPQSVRVTVWDSGIFLYLAAAAVSIPLSVSVRSSVIGTIEIAALTGMYLLLSVNATSHAVWDDLFTAIVATSSASAVVAIGQAFAPGSLVPLLENHPTGNLVVEQRVSGFFANPNSLALMLLLAILLLVEAIIRGGTPVRRAGLSALAIICLTALALTYSREAAVGLVVGGASLLLIAMRTTRARLASLSVLALVVLALLALPGVQDRVGSVMNLRDDPSAMDRVYLSHVSVRMFADHPLTGLGQSSFMAAYPPYADPRVTINPVPNGHQMPFSIPAETGLLGLVSELLMVGALGLAAFRAPRLAAAGVRVAGIATAVAFFVMSFVNGFWFAESFWVTLALVGVVFRVAPIGLGLALGVHPFRATRVHAADV